jgi:hypothetical protein
MLTHLLIAAMILALITLGISLWINYDQNRKESRLYDQKGKEVHVQPDVILALIQEFKLIQLKQSGFSATKRKKIEQLIEHLLMTGKITRSQLKD